MFAIHLFDLIPGFKLFIEESSKFLCKKMNEKNSVALDYPRVSDVPLCLSVLKQGLVRHCRCFYTLKCLKFPEQNQIHLCPLHFNTIQDASVCSPVSSISVALHMILMPSIDFSLTNYRLVTGFIQFDQSELNEEVIFAILHDYLCVVMVLNS